MTTLFAEAPSAQRATSAYTDGRVSQTKPARTSSFVYVAVVEAVAECLRSAIRVKEGCTADGEHTFETTHSFCNRRVGVRYVAHSVHCGTQVTTSVRSLGHNSLDPIAAVAVRVIDRRIAASLLAMRDELE